MQYSLQKCNCIFFPNCVLLFTFFSFSLDRFSMDMCQGRGYQYAAPDRDSLNKGVSDLMFTLVSEQDI